MAKVSFGHGIALVAWTLLLHDHFVTVLKEARVVSKVDQGMKQGKYTITLLPPIFVMITMETKEMLAGSSYKLILAIIFIYYKSST